MNFNKVTTTSISGLEITKYECTSAQQGYLEDLQNIVMQKIKNMRINKNIVDLLPYIPPNLSTEFMQRLQDKTAEVAKPKDHKIIAFNVRRSRVTEFMSQVLLEHEFGCVFADEYDKRMNLDFHQSDKHVSGIDVTGYKKDGDDFKFIVCEVKASSQKSVPSSSAKKLYDDVKANANDHIRVLREIEDVAMKIGEHHKDFEAVMEFLLSLISHENSKEVLREKIIIIPFFIREYSDKLQSSEWTKEFSMYDMKETHGHEVVGYLWSFEHSLKDFVESTYEKALA